MISVVMPLYNKAEQVEASLRSVLAQSYKDYEIVVVDDGSIDGSTELVENLEIDNLRLIRQNNAGVSAARNRGIEEARGEFVAFLDADDLWKPDYLAVQFEMTQKYPDCDVFATDYEFKDSVGKVSPTVLNKLGINQSGIFENYFEVASCSNPPLWTSAVMTCRSALLAIGGFPLGIRSGEDLLTWARLACRYRIAYCRKPLAIFNVEGYDVSEKPKRVPAEDDVVGRELKRLMDDYKTPGLRAYCSMWHKMRASVYMRLRMREKAFRETIKAISLAPANYKLYAYLVINMLPSKLQPF
ncbi:MAG: glycosyltransferase family 2 protein [Lachnoclostridium sp.]|nr:glycosyltransferase family 2 protein [Lachnoclostridium sp.]